MTVFALMVAETIEGEWVYSLDSIYISEEAAEGAARDRRITDYYVEEYGVNS